MARADFRQPPYLRCSRHHQEELGRQACVRDTAELHGTSVQAGQARSQNPDRLLQHLDTTDPVLTIGARRCSELLSPRASHRTVSAHSGRPRNTLLASTAILPSVDQAASLPNQDQPELWMILQDVMSQMVGDWACSALSEKVPTNLEAIRFRDTSPLLTRTARGQPHNLWTALLLAAPCLSEIAGSSCQRHIHRSSMDPRLARNILAQFAHILHLRQSWNKHGSRSKTANTRSSDANIFPRPRRFPM